MPAKKRVALRKTTTTGGGGTCFVVSPFGGWHDRYYQEVFRPAVEAAGLEPKRADDLYRPSAIVQDIWSYVSDARVMLADLTGKNPNVFYELGLGHAVGKPVILLTQAIEDVPFDLRILRVLEYDLAEPNWGGILRDKITQAIREVLEAPERAVLQPFQRLPQQKPAASASPGDQRLLALEQQIDLLRAELRTTGSRRGSIDIGPDAAEDLIRTMVQAKVPSTEIMRTLLRLGPPRNWIERRLVEVGAAATAPAVDEASDRSASS